MEGDPLTDVLTLASARCVRIGTLKAGGTWALKFPPPQKIKLTAVVKGTCWVPVDGERALRLETGDVFVVPAERSYVLASDLKASQIDGLALFTRATDNVATVGDGKDFFAIGGHVSLDPDRGGVLADVMPPVIHSSGSSSWRGLIASAQTTCRQRSAPQRCTGHSSRSGDNAVISIRQTRRPDSNRASAHQVSPMR